ncbi:MAG: carbamoyltransferase HypF [Rhodospirillum sp.]|nr:carbamoyltransferase HypF [Rhodospirillum sp.]MCF8490987.1 carbamoyltransferase HypF [Rhodospirillum sp.]MCF8499494.1 carbamoyltransferase HypF [Rhodospirillum sp.]
METAVHIRIRGQVQGVGFRPFVWRLARDMGLRGSVRNDAEGVWIHAAGGNLNAFAQALREQAPPLARVDRVEVTATPDLPEGEAFTITVTTTGAARTGVTPDAMTCPTCAAEVLDPADRRFAYPFANCTHCGPRFSIVEAIPYDRGSTTMAGFRLCPDCHEEYDDPADRRFHAQPIACPTCGPKAWLEVGGNGRILDTPDPITAAAAHLREGAILAIKGIGGFHLACDARNEKAVTRLRVRKHRPTKPFALMAPDLGTITHHARVSELEAQTLASPAAPIVLLEAAGDTLAPSVAPGQWALGWMLPTSPLHLLLLRAFGGPLVMTSGNLSGEPQAIDNGEARKKLTPFADLFLMHDRPIARRLDDSVARVVAGRVRLLRRARGYAPEALPLPPGLDAAPAVLAHGGLLKSTLCLTREGEALLSHHLGDLDDALTAEEYAKADRDYAALMDHAPEVLAHDLHPDYPSTARAEARARETGLPLEPVQHHHAHVAAVMAENGWPLDGGKVLGVALDGLGWGPDGTVWGGEFLLCDYRDFTRLACLKPVPLPGGGAAQSEPWRNLLAQLDSAGFTEDADRLLAGRPLAPLRAAMAKGVNSPLSSSCGRLFDAVAAALGVGPDKQSHEGEAAMTLEALARPHMDWERLPHYRLFLDGESWLDPSPLWRALLDDLGRGVSRGIVAARFHRGLAESIAETALTLAGTHGARAIALTGGCFQNATLFEAVLMALGGFPTLTHALVPPNDGGLSLGQAVVAGARRVIS